MKKVLMFTMVAALLLAVTVPGYSWTGRMAGMGNPYGLVEDESDFLTHPTAITQGKGWQYYGDLGINYKDVKKWDVSGYFGGTGFTNIRSGDGSEWNTDASFGFTLPVNTGRMGVFLQYGGNFLSRAKYDGNGAYTSLIGNYGTFDIRNDTDTFSGRILYAQPFTDTLKFGGEFSVGYVKEKSSTSYAIPLVSTVVNGENYHYDVMFLNGFQYALPYDSEYWEAKMKASVEGKVGSSKLNFTAFGGFIFSGKNDYTWSFAISPPGIRGDHNGSVSGYHIGAESWWRFPVNNSITIPVLAKAVYSEKKRDGSGSFYSYGYYNGDYNSTEKAFNIEVGGGIDARFAKKGRFAAGLYYDYMNNRNDFFFFSDYSGFTTNYPSSPKWREHRITLKLAGELGINPNVVFNGGLNFFYGWVKQDFERQFSFPYNLGFDGHNWGLGLSAGAAFTFNGFVFEPYLKGSYQGINTSGTGAAGSYLNTLNTYASGDYKKNQWIFGGGFAIKFN